MNFLGDEGEARVRAAYPGATWDRSEIRIASLLEDLGSRLAAIHAGERAALEATARAIGR